MPVVPDYGGLKAAPTVRSDAQFAVPTMSGAQIAARQMEELGQASLRAGSALSAISADVLQQENQVRVNDAMNRAMEARLKWTHDKDVGYTALQGRAALDRPDGKSLADEYSEKLKGDLDGIAGTLGNDAQRRAFAFQSSQMLTQFQGQVLGHMLKENQQYKLGVQSGTVQVAQQQMALGWNDPDATEQSRSAIKAAVAEAGRLQGMSGAEIQAKTVVALSEGHMSVLAAAADAGKLDYAREYLTQVKDELTPAARLRITQVLDAGDFEIRTQALAGDLWVKHKGDAAGALAAAREQLKGKEQDAVVQRLKVLDAEQETITKRNERDAYDQGLLLVEKGQPVPPTLLAAMGEGHHAAIIERQRAEAKAAAAAAAGKPVKTDWSLYIQLRDQAAADPGEFRKLDLGRYVDRIGGAQMEQLLDLRGKLVSDANKPAKAGREATSLTQQMNAAMAAAGMKKPETKGKFMSYVQAEVDDAMEAKGGKPLTYDERQQVIDRALLKGRDPDAILPWGTRRMFELTPEQRTRFKPDAPTDAPATEIDALNEALKSQGIPQTPANRLALYQRTMSKRGQQ